MLGLGEPGSVDYTQVEQMARESADDMDGLLFAPWLSGERVPVFDDAARASFVGLSLHHGPGHFPARRNGGRGLSDAVGAGSTGSTTERGSRGSGRWAADRWDRCGPRSSPTSWSVRWKPSPHRRMPGDRSRRMRAALGAGPNPTTRSSPTGWRSPVPICPMRLVRANTAPGMPNTNGSMTPSIRSITTCEMRLRR